MINKIIDSYLNDKGYSITKKINSGLTNKNFLITKNNINYILKILNKNPHIFGFDREQEVQNYKLINEQGLGASIVEWDKSLNILIVEYIFGRNLLPSELKNKNILIKMIREVKRFHSMRNFSNDFNPIEKLNLYQNYLKKYDIQKFNKLQLNMSFILQNEWQFENLVPCHNDLLLENFIFKNSSTIRLIDFEFAGNNLIHFDIGNMWSELNLEINDLYLFCSVYFNSKIEYHVLKCLKQSIFANYLWSHWGYLQRIFSDIEFNYDNWANDKLTKMHLLRQLYEELIS